MVLIDRSLKHPLKDLLIFKNFPSLFVFIKETRLFFDKRFYFPDLIDHIFLVAFNLFLCSLCFL